ncbi:8375_t:CDS:2, partial [Diversispora eburnea]
MVRKDKKSTICVCCNSSLSTPQKLRQHYASDKNQCTQLSTPIQDKLELINTRETLRVAEAWNIDNESNSEDSNKNSQDSYTPNTDMTTIPDLSKAIDGYLDNPRTDRRILVDQIKRATRQIRRKYTNDQTYLINEQQNRYNAETERDLRQTDLDNALNDLNLMTMAYNNERNTRQQYFLELQQC